MRLRRWLKGKRGMNDRVPPGQHLVSGFPVLHVGPVPSFEAQTWRLRLFDLVHEEQRGYHMYGDPWHEQRYSWD